MECTICNNKINYKKFYSCTKCKSYFFYKNFVGIFLDNQCCNYINIELNGLILIFDGKSNYFNIDVPKFNSDLDKYNFLKKFYDNLIFT